MCKFCVLVAPSALMMCLLVGTVHAVVPDPNGQLAFTESDSSSTSAATATLIPTTLAFSAQALGTTSAGKTVTLINSATTTLTISSIVITGTNAEDFAQTNNCGTALLGSCTVKVIFKPKAVGTRTAVLRVSDDASGSPQHVSLSGIGTTAKLFPTSVNFGTVAVGVTTYPKTVTLTNIGTSTLTIYGISLTGTNVGDFSQTHNCASTLTVGASCSIYVRFKPVSIGPRTSALSISDSAAGSPQKVSLTGLGTTAKLSPTSLNFGSIDTGIISVGKAVMLTNVGGSTLNIAGISITGTNAREFAETNSCGPSLQPGSSCSINIVFTPRATGTRSAALSVSDDASGSPQAVSLTGVGAGGTCITHPPSNLGSYAFRRGLIDLVFLGWIDHATDEDSYHLERCAGSTCTNFAEIAVLGANVIQYTDGLWPASLTFRYRVRAHCAAGYSAYSNIRTQSTP